MVEERTCDYTGESIEPGTGIMYIETDGTILHFVDSKAEKNYFMGREARDLPWTEAGRAQAEARRPDEPETDEVPDESPEPEDEAATDDDATASTEEDDAPEEDPDVAEDTDDADASEAADDENADQ